MRKQNILIALVLALTLILSASTMSTFAISGDTSGDQAQTVYNPNLTPESATDSGSGTLYNPNLRSGGSDEPDDQNDNEEPGTPDVPGDPNDPDDPDNPDEPPVAAHMLTGTVYEHSYAGTADTAAPSEKEIKIKLADGTEKAVSGTFSLVLDEGQVNESGEYEWSYAKTEDYLAASGTIKEEEENKIYLRERYVPQTADYQFAPSEDIINRILRKAGIYKIIPTGDNKLSLTQDGEKEDSLMIKVEDDGSFQDFYIYTGDDCSKALTGQKAKIDDGAPKIGEITSESNDDDTYFKSHGIYARESAELLINAEITEKGVGLAKVVLIGRPADSDGSDEEEDVTTYEPVNRDDLNGIYTFSIPIPEDKSILDQEVLYLVARDKFGNSSEAKLIANNGIRSTVTVEAKKPVIARSVSSRPNANGWYNKLPSFTATAIDKHSGLNTLSVTEDGKELVSAAYTEKVNERRTLSAKAQVKEPSKDGSYTFRIAAKDNAGNEKTDSFKLKIDLAAPVLSADGITKDAHYNNVPDIRVSENEKYYSADGAYIRYKIRRDGKEVTVKDMRRTNSFSIPGSSFGKDGVYKVSMNAEDAAGNASNTVSYDFVKDTVAPVVKWSGVQDGKFYNKSQTLTLTVKEKWYKTNKVNVGGTRKLNGSHGVGFSWSNDKKTSSHSKTLSETGTYTFTASATDKAGNSSGTKKITFTIDTKSPEIKITGVRDGGVYGYGQGVAPKVEVTDDYLDSKSISYTKAGVGISNPSFAQEKENDGLYTMTVTATDKAGNRTTKTVSFTLNRFGSYFEYDPAVQKTMGNAFQNIDEDLVIIERNLSQVNETENKVYRDGRDVSNSAVTNESLQEDGYNVYRHVFGKSNFTEEGAYEINVISKDEAGNEMESKDENGKVVFYVDRTPPTLTVEGIDPKGIKAETATLTVKASDLLTGVEDVAATVDGQPVGITEAGEGSYTLNVGEGMRQAVRLTATDGAGNTATFEDTVSVSPSGFSLFLNRFKLPIGLGAAAALGAGGWILIGKRRKDEDDDKENEEDQENMID